MPSTSTKSKSSGSASRHKVKSVPKMMPLAASESRPIQSYVVVDAALPSHIVNDRSLFTTYTPGRKVHRTVFGHNIIIEGTGDVHIRVFVAGQYICFRMRNCWHVPLSPRHFLSCSMVVSLGHQVMIAGCSPRLIFSHKRRLIQPNLPKYLPFTRLDGLIVLKLEFETPAQVFLPPQSALTTTQSTVDSESTVLSLQASMYHPFAGLAFNRLERPLPTPEQHEASFPSSSPSVSEAMATNAHKHANSNVRSESDAKSAGVVLNGGAHAQVHMDARFRLNNDSDVIVMPHGGEESEDACMLMPVNATVDVIVNEDAGPGEQAANTTYGGDLNNRFKTDFLGTLNLSLDFFDLRVEDDFIVRLSTHSSSRTSSLSRSFTSISNINPPCSPSPFSTNFPFLLSFSPFFASFRLGQLHESFSQVFCCSIPFPFPPLRPPHVSAVIPSVHFEVFSLPITIYSPAINYFHPIFSHNFASSSLHTSTAAYQSFSGLFVPLHFFFPFSYLSFSHSQSHIFVSTTLSLPFSGFGFSFVHWQAPLLPVMQGHSSPSCSCPST
jgi:hypothetical protein